MECVVKSQALKEKAQMCPKIEMIKNGNFIFTENICHQFLQYFILYQLWIVDLKHVSKANKLKSH